VIASGVLQCRGCGTAWPVYDGVPHLYDPATVRGSDFFLRFVYDWIAPWHDLSVKLVLPILQWESAASARDGYMRRLQLSRLAPHDDGTPVRILEVGIGGGANLPLIERDLPSDIADLEIWGIDLSPGMLAQCQRHIRGTRFGRQVRLMLADAHALPFPDASFDRVFHVGGIAGYRDPRLGLAEMARVARPEAPIVVVDEQLDRERSNSLYYRFIFRAITIYDPHPHAPANEIPAHALCDESTQVSRFYYCLRFHVPAATSAPPPTPMASAASSRKESPSMNPSNPGNPTAGGLASILQPAQLQTLKAAYNDVTMTNALSTPLPALYPLAQEYIDALRHAFYGSPGPAPLLTADNRERCLIGILASRGANRNLAIHIYMALMVGVRADEIGHILLLTGAYSGVDNLAHGLTIAKMTLEILAQLASGSQQPTPSVVLTDLAKIPL
jgi:SAM-dependent methyltransferase/alkylhydroperoxidase/carboxymuconolactone decarboxylase family protein YurZ